MRVLDVLQERFEADGPARLHILLVAADAFEGFGLLLLEAPLE